MRKGKILAFILAVALFGIPSVQAVPGPTCEFYSTSIANITEFSTGNVSIAINCSNANSSAIWIARTVKGALNTGKPNYQSIRPPHNNQSASAPAQNIKDQILLADGRQDGKEHDYLMVSGENVWHDNHTFAVMGNSSPFVVTTDYNTTLATINFTGPVQSLLRSSVYLKRGKLTKADKSATNYSVYFKHPLQEKFWDLERMRGTENYTLVIATNLGYEGNPTNDDLVYICNSSYDPNDGHSCSEDIDHCVYLDAYNEADADNASIVWHNSEYFVKYYEVVNGRIGGVNLTDYGYLCHESLTNVNNAWQFPYFNGSSGSNVSFKDTNVTWTSTDDFDTAIEQNGSVDFQLYSIVQDDEIQIAVFALDGSLLNYTNLAIYTDTVGGEEWGTRTMSTPRFDDAHNGNVTIDGGHETDDEDFNGSYGGASYSGYMTVHIHMPIDPDYVGGPDCALYLYGTDGTFNMTINASFDSYNDADISIFIDTTTLPDGEWNFNLSCNGTDGYGATDTSDVQSVMTNGNFTISNPEGRAPADDPYIPPGGGGGWMPADDDDDADADEEDIVESMAESDLDLDIIPTEADLLWGGGFRVIGERLPFDFPSFKTILDVGLVFLWGLAFLSMGGRKDLPHSFYAPNIKGSGSIFLIATLWSILAFVYWRTGG